jgi:hypothetical protein
MEYLISPCGSMTRVQPPFMSNSVPLFITVHACVTSATRSKTTRPSGAARRVTRTDCTDGGDA